MQKTVLSCLKTSFPQVKEHRLCPYSAVNVGVRVLTGCFDNFHMHSQALLGYFIV